MVDVPTYRWSEGTVEPVAVDESAFGDTIKWRLLREAVLMYEANKRVGTHCAKTRGEVTGTTKKPWRQKGTGRARSGTKKSPIWRGGGIVHGPRPRDYSYSLPRKSLNVALRCAMLGKLRDAEVRGIDAIVLDEPKTKKVVEAMAALAIPGSALIILPESDANAHRSGRNIARCEVRIASEVNAYDVIRAGTVIVVGDALRRIQERVA